MRSTMTEKGEKWKGKKQDSFLTPCHVARKEKRQGRLGKRHITRRDGDVEVGGEVATKGGGNTDSRLVRAVSKRRENTLPFVTRAKRTGVIRARKREKGAERNVQRLSLRQQSSKDFHRKNEGRYRGAQLTHGSVLYIEKRKGSPTGEKNNTTPMSTYNHGLVKKGKSIKTTLRVMMKIR